MNLKTVSAILAVICFFFVTAVFATQYTGVGNVANNILEPVSVLSDFVKAACFIIGGSFLFASIIKYIEHRRSPLMVPISTVIFLIFGGLALIGLPFIWMLAQYANN